MSRIGRMPITVPAGVDVTIGAGNLVTVKGPKGSLTQKLHPDMKIELSDGVLHVSRPSDEKEHCALHGLTRNLLNNMVTGVTTGFSKTLEISGVGYRAQKQDNMLIMNLGFSHQITVKEVDGIEIEVPAANRVRINGIDKQKVGQFAANIRAIRPVEPYNGKGIKYQGEVVRHKEGKTGAKK
jgi:large subunit ribosomal protein L6